MLQEITDGIIASFCDMREGSKFFESNQEGPRQVDILNECLMAIGKLFRMVTCGGINRQYASGNDVEFGAQILGIWGRRERAVLIIFINLGVGGDN